MGLRLSCDATRPGDLVVLDLAVGGKHLIIDGVVTSVYRNSIMSRVASVQVFTAKQAGDMKFKG